MKISKLGAQRLWNVFNTFWKQFQNILESFWVTPIFLETFWKRFGNTQSKDILKLYDQSVLFTTAIDILKCWDTHYTICYFKAYWSHFLFLRHQSLSKSAISPHILNKLEFPLFFPNLMMELWCKHVNHRTYFFPFKSCAYSNLRFYELSQNTSWVFIPIIH